VLSPEAFYRPWPRNKGKRIKMRIDANSLVGRIMESKYDLVEFYGAELGLLVDKLSRVKRENRPLLVAHTNGLELLASESPRTAQHNPKNRFLNPLVQQFCIQ
jgi:hypothetical protein